MRTVSEEFGIELHGRADLPLALGDGLVIVEVGVDRGHFAAELLSRHASRVVHYLAVDPYLPYPEMPWSRRFDERSAQLLLQPWPQVRFIPLPSIEAAVVLERPLARRTWESRPLNLVYVDAAHDRDHVLADLRAWWPHVADGGLLAGHDFDERSHQPVIDAVLEFGHEVGFEVLRLPDQGPDSWAIRKPIPERTT